MAKNSIIISCSISKEDEELISIYNLSPSKLLQEKIEEARKMLRMGDNEKLRQTIKAMQELISDYSDFLTNTKQFEDFSKYRGFKHGAN